ncbi:MAG: GldG family protein [Anaerolineales bacterium]|nr:GldG family protein [Anaerolineales bacterium]MBX3035300.1 GldG family protein [Anaerolineales bacterium]
MAGKKKNPNAQYAFAALIVALIACVATGLIGSSKILTGIGMFTLQDDQIETVNLAFQISIALVVLGLATYAILAPDAIRRFLTGRQARYGSNSLILALAFIGILFAANYIVYNNQDLLGAPWDFTEDKSNTLAPETLDILNALPENIKATAYYSNAINPQPAQELLQKFKNNSNGKFDYVFVDPNQNPLEVRQAGITGDGKILLQMGEAKEIASSANEAELARAMIRLINPTQRVVYFLQGHGEATLNPADERSFTTAQQTLEEKNYIVKPLNLLSETEIPADAEVIVVAGPQKPLSQDEVNMLKGFVDKGGSLVVMQDPRALTEFGTAYDPIAKYLSQDWGIIINNDLILDFSGTTDNQLNAVSESANMHPITQNLSQNYAVIMPNAQSLSTKPLDSVDVVVTPLIFTSANSYGETKLDVSEGEQIQYDEGIDNIGPLNMAVAGENLTTKGRVVVFGNSLFAINAYFDVYGNGNFFINSLDWAAEQENLINLTTRPQTQRIFLPPSQLRFLILGVVMIIVIPGMVVFFGISSWIARRRRG